MHIWPHIGKAKMGLGGGSFFQFSKICLHFSAVCLQFFKKTTASQTHFGFANMGSEVLSFWVMGLRKGQFWFGSPCSITKLLGTSFAMISKSAFKNDNKFRLILWFLYFSFSNIFTELFTRTSFTFDVAIFAFFWNARTFSTKNLAKTWTQSISRYGNIRLNFDATSAV